MCPNPSPFIFRVEIPTHFLTQTNFFYFNNNNETVLIILSYKKDSFEDTPLRRTTAISIPTVPSGLFSSKNLCISASNMYLTSIKYINIVRNI